MKKILFLIIVITLMFMVTGCPRSFTSLYRDEPEYYDSYPANTDKPKTEATQEPAEDVEVVDDAEVRVNNKTYESVTDENGNFVMPESAFPMEFDLGDMADNGYTGNIIDSQIYPTSYNIYAEFKGAKSDVRPTPSASIRIRAISPFTDFYEQEAGYIKDKFDNGVNTYNMDKADYSDPESGKVMVDDTLSDREVLWLIEWEGTNVETGEPLPYVSLHYHAMLYDFYYVEIHMVLMPPGEQNDMFDMLMNTYVYNSLNELENAFSAYNYSTLDEIIED